MKTSGAAALAVALVACATTGDPPATAPATFEDVRSVALVRWRDDPGAARAKDPLDALEESLAARGVTTRTVEVGRRTEEALRSVDRLHARLAGRIGGGPARGRSGEGAEPLGEDAAAAVAALGVDAVALHHRPEELGRTGLPSATLPGDPMYPPMGSSTQRQRPRPLGALSLVDRHGNAVWFAWGDPAAELDPEAPVNAAEAIDAVLRVLAGEEEPR